MGVRQPEVKELKNIDSFYKWFFEVQTKLLEKDFPGRTFEDDFIFSSIIEDDDEENEDIILEIKKRLEKVKKYLGSFSDRDVLLELAEDERTKSDFVWKYCPLETFSILGAIAFFHGYLKNEPEASKSLKEVRQWVGKFKAGIGSNSGSQSVIAMEKVLDGLEQFYSVRIGEKISKVNPGNCDQDLAEILAIKSYFISGFSNELLPERVKLADKKVQVYPDNFAWNLNRYKVKRAFRLYDSKNTVISPSEDEKLDLEKAFKKNPDHPCNILAACQYLTDELTGNDPSEVIFADIKFQKPSDVVNFIMDKAKEITENFPSFLRAHFTFAEIFANELPITRQDRPFAKSLLEKALNANPTSSKINQKFALFSIKGRLFNEGKNYLQKAVEYDPKNASAQYSLIKLLLKDPTGSNKELLEKIFGDDFSRVSAALGPINELQFWKGCFYFATGDMEIAVGLWAEIILQFYVSKPELELEVVLPFEELPNSADMFFWTRSPLTLENIEPVVQKAFKEERTRRRAVLNRVLDLVKDALMSQKSE